MKYELWCWFSCSLFDFAGVDEDEEVVTESAAADDMPPLEGDDEDASRMEEVD